MGLKCGKNKRVRNTLGPSLLVALYTVRPLDSIRYRLFWKMKGIRHMRIRRRHIYLYIFSVYVIYCVSQNLERPPISVGKRSFRQQDLISAKCFSTIHILYRHIQSPFLSIKHLRRWRDPPSFGEWFSTNQMRRLIQYSR